MTENNLRKVSTDDLIEYARAQARESGYSIDEEIKAYAVGVLAYIAMLGLNGDESGLESIRSVIHASSSKRGSGSSQG